MTKQLPAERDNRQWLTLKDAADVLGIHYTTLRTWADNGDIPVFRTPGGHRRFQLGDLRRFLESRVSQSQLANVDGLMAVALSHVRQEISKLPAAESGWRAEITPESAETNRERGRRLFALALNYLIRPEQRERLLADGRAIGREYGAEAAQSHLSLAETGRAVQFFRRQLLEVVRRDENLDAEDVQIRQLIAQYLDEVLYAVLDGYEQSLLAGSK
jgi:excisionase family DNA binding protein